MLYKLGLGLHSTEFREVNCTEMMISLPAAPAALGPEAAAKKQIPTAHTRDGGEACSYTPLEGQLDCDDFYEEPVPTSQDKPAAPGGIPVSVIIALAVICGLVGTAALCGLSAVRGKRCAMIWSF